MAKFLADVQCPLGNRKERQMNHQRIQDELSAYLDDELSQAKHEQVAAHLRGCAECRAKLAAFQRNRRQVAGLAHPVPPIKDAVMARIRALEAQRPVPVSQRIGIFFKDAALALQSLKGTMHWFFRPITAGASAVLTLAFIIGFLYLYPTGTHYEEALDFYFGIHAEQVSGSPLRSNVGTPLSSDTTGSIATADEAELFEFYLEE